VVGSTALASTPYNAISPANIGNELKLAIKHEPILAIIKEAKSKCLRLYLSAKTPINSPEKEYVT
jgi:hypothetical protein